MVDDLLERIPHPNEVKQQLAVHLRAVELLKRLLKLSEQKTRITRTREDHDTTNPDKVEEHP